MLKILQARLQQYVNCELPDIQAGFRNGRGTRDQTANIHRIIEKAREFQKTSTSALLITPEPLVCRSQQTVENSLRDGNTGPPYLPPEKFLYAGQEVTVRTGHETKDWFQIGKGVHQGCILSPCLFNLYAGYIMLNAGLDEAQAGMRMIRLSQQDFHTNRMKLIHLKRKFNIREKGAFKSYFPSLFSCFSENVGTGELSHSLIDPFQ